MLLTTIQSKEIHTMIYNKGIIWPKKREMKCKLKHIKKAYRRIARYASEKKKEQYKTYPFWCSYTDIGINCMFFATEKCNKMQCKSVTPFGD